MSTVRQHIGLMVAIATVCVAGPAYAAPRLDAGFTLDSQLVFPDHERTDVYYLSPPPVRIAEIDDRPDIKLSLTYYVGSGLRDDRDKRIARWALQVGIERTPRSSVMRARFEAMLKTEVGRGAELHEIPVLGVPTSVEFGTIDTPEDRLRLGYGHVLGKSAADKTSGSGRADSAYWTKRKLSFHLGPFDGVALREAMQEGGALMTVSYGYRVAGVVRDQDSEWMRDHDVATRKTPGAPEPIWQPTTRLVAPDSLAIDIDAKAHPDFVSTTDLHTLAPPGYAGLLVLSTDFQLDPADYLFEEKEVEIEASSVAGSPVRTTVRFPADDPEVTLLRADFGYAVRVDRPYRYRIRAYDLEGQELVSDWVQEDQWARPLDISGPITNAQEKL